MLRAKIHITRDTGCGCPTYSCEDQPVNTSQSLRTVPCTVKGKEASLSYHFCQDNRLQGDLSSSFQAPCAYPISILNPSFPPYNVWDCVELWRGFLKIVTMWICEGVRFGSCDLICITHNMLRTKDHVGKVVGRGTEWRWAELLNQRRWT